MRRIKIVLIVLILVSVSICNVGVALGEELSNIRTPFQIQKALEDNFQYNAQTMFSVDGSKPFITKGQYMQDGSLMVNANQMGEMLGVTANFKKFYPLLMFSAYNHDYYFQDMSNEIGVKQVDGFKMNTYSKFIDGIVYAPANFAVNCFSDYIKTIYNKDKNIIYIYSNTENNNDIIKGEKMLEYITFEPTTSTKIYYNDKLISMTSQYIHGNGETYKSYDILTIPLYKIINSMGGSTVYGKRKDYNVYDNSITASANNKTLIFSDGYNFVFDPDSANLDQMSVMMDYKARIMPDNHIYVPVSTINYFCDSTKTIFDNKNNEIRFYN